MGEIEMHTCSLLPKCGAAPLSYMPYSKQADYKRGLFREAFKKVGAKVPDFEFIPAPVPYFYRNRMDYTVSFRGEFGLRERGKWWRVLDGHACIVADKTIRRAFKLVNSWVKGTSLPYYDRKKHTGFLKYVVIRSNLDNELLLNIVTTPPEIVGITSRFLTDELVKLIEMFKGNPVNIVLSFTPLKSDRSIGKLYKVVYGQDFLAQTINGFKYKVYANAFFQNNPCVAALLQNKVVETVKGFKNEFENIYDLYGGAGFLGIALARVFRTKVNVVEEFGESTKAGEENARLNGVSKLVRFTTSTVSEYLSNFYQTTGKDVFVLDPPRVGLSNDVLKFLIAKGPKYLVYVSCKYTRFLEEFYKLGLAAKYRIKQVTVFDMFPLTEHVESLFYLVRK